MAVLQVLLAAGNLENTLCNSGLFLHYGMVSRNCTITPLLVSRGHTEAIDQGCPCVSVSLDSRMPCGWSLWTHRWMFHLLVKRGEKKKTWYLLRKLTKFKIFSLRRETWTMTHKKTWYLASSWCNTINDPFTSILDLMRDFNVT